MADLFTQFVQKVHGALPQTRIIFVSIKPSVRRWSSIDKIRSANAMIREFCAKHEGLTYLNIEPQMLGLDGRPRPELLVEDGLHMTPEGYKIWTAALKPYLK